MSFCWREVARNHHSTPPTTPKKKNLKKRIFSHIADELTSVLKETINTASNEDLNNCTKEFKHCAWMVISNFLKQISAEDVLQENNPQALNTVQKVTYNCEWPLESEFLSI